MPTQFNTYIAFISVGFLLFVFLLVFFQLRRLMLHFQCVIKRNSDPLYEGKVPVAQFNSLEKPFEVDKLSQLVFELEQTKRELEDQKEKLEDALLMVERDNFRKTLELLEAQQLQVSMLPQYTPFYPGFEISMISRPATEVGGDYYDFKFSCNSKQLHLVLGDATGHGFKPAVLVATAKSYFQTLAGRNSNEQIISRISEAIQSLNIKGLYMGLSLLEMDGDLISVVSSGMPPLYFYNSRQKEGEQHLFKGMFLGLPKVNSGRKKVFRMHRGDVLLLMTDGLAELQNCNRELLGYQAVKEAFARVAGKGTIDIIEGLLKLGKEWAGEEHQQDDISIIAIRKK